LRVAAIVNQIMVLKEKKQALLLEQAAEENCKQRVNELLEIIDQERITLNTYDDVLVRRLVDRVKIFDESIVIVFKAGLEVEVNI